MPKTPDVPSWSRDVQDKFLKFKPGSDEVEKAKAAMIAEGQAAKTFRNGEKVPEFIQAERAKRGVGGNTPVASPTRQQQPDIEDIIEAQPQPVRTAVEVVETPPVVPVPQPVAVEPARTPVAEPETQRKRIETKKFVGEMYKDGKEWVFELTYKNGAGSERFTALSKDELLMKVGEGKGFGTVKVRETVQRYKLGDIFDQWDVFYNEVRDSHGLTLEQYNALPEQSRQLIQDNIQAAAILEFKALYKEYYAVQSNFEKIGQYLNSRKIPLTLHNLELAYRDLSEDDLLETRPVQKEVVSATPTPQVTVPAAPPQTEDSVVEVPVTPVAVTPVAAVRKRGSSALAPGQSSASPATVAAPLAEDGAKSQEPSEEELRQLRDAATRGDFSQLKRIATAGRKYGRY